MEGAHVHWQAGQGERERRGGEEGPGLLQRDPEGDIAGRVATERGEMGRVHKDSRLAEALTGGEVLPDGKEEEMDEMGMVVGSDVHGVSVEDVFAGSEVAVWQEVWAEVNAETVREELAGSVCKGGEGDAFGMGESGTEVEKKGMGEEESAAGVKGKGEVMRGIGEGGWGEKGKVEDWRGSAGGSWGMIIEGGGDIILSRCDENGTGAKSLSEIEDS